jgi:hypothetical protein
MQGENFKEALPMVLDPNAVFVDFTPEKALEHLLNFGTLSFTEKYSSMIF